MTQNLANVIGAQANLVDFLRNQQVGPNVYPGVPAEYSNWRAEQWAWGHTAVLYNQSYHMVDLAVRGPDAFKMLEYLGINTFKNFQPDRAKQFVPVTPDGYVIGDVILFYLDENEFNLVGRAPTIEWVEYHAATGNWNVTVERDERWAMRNDGKRNSYRFQIQGPNAMKIIEKATGKTPPELKFFHMTRMTIGGKDVRALRHGMAGQPGFELFGPWEDYGAVHAGLFVVALFSGDITMKALVERILRRFGHRNVLTINGVICAASLLSLSAIGPHSPAVLVAALLFVNGLARSLQFSSLSTLAFADVDRTAMGDANGLFNTILQLGAAAGVTAAAMSVHAGDALAGTVGLNGQGADYRFAFIAMAVLSLGGVISALKLPHEAGKTLTAG